MSDTGDSDDSSEFIPSGLRYRQRRNLRGNERITRSGNQIASTSSSGNNNNSKKRKIVMIEYDDDSDDSGTTEDDAISNESNDIKPSSSTRSKRFNNKFLESSNDDSDDSEITRTKISVRGRKTNKAVIPEDDKDDSSSPPPPKLLSIPGSSSSIQQVEDGFNSDSSSNELLEKCPICLLTFRNQEVGTPGVCEHNFCATCIEEWSRNVQTCPIDRQEFSKILVRATYENSKIIREIKVEAKKNATIEEEEEDDVVLIDEMTYCQVCNRSTREEVLLLCDGCNLGYHTFCLVPPLDNVPSGFWYCDNCFDSEDESDVAENLNDLYEDIRDLGIPETRLRITEVRQPRILRTRQSERIRASIVSRTRGGGASHISDIDVNEPGIFREVRNRAVGGNFERQLRNGSITTTTTTTTTTRQTMTRQTTKVPNKKRKKRKRKTRRKRTYVVEYDVNNYDEKFALKTTKKYIRKRRTKKKKLSKARKEQAKRSSARLAEQFGIKHLQENLRPSGGAQSFSLFGNPDQLEYFSDSDGGDINFNFSSGPGGTAIQTAVRLHNLPGTGLRRRKGLIANLESGIARAPVDLLSNIMDMQDRFLSATRQDRISSVKISSDGSLHFDNPNPEIRRSIPTATQTSESITTNTSTTTQTPALSTALERNTMQNLLNSSSSDRNTTNETNNVAPSDINQAPLYPRGGGGGGNFNNRFNNQSNYRGGNTSSGNAGGGYRHSTGGIDTSGGGTTSDFNSNRRDSFAGNNTNFQTNTPNQPNNQNFSPFRFNRQTPQNRRNNNNNNNNRFNNNRGQNFSQDFSEDFSQDMGLNNSFSNDNLITIQSLSDSQQQNQNVENLNNSIPQLSKQPASINDLRAALEAPPPPPPPVSGPPPSMQMGNNIQVQISNPVSFPPMMGISCPPPPAPPPPLPPHLLMLQQPPPPIIPVSNVSAMGSAINQRLISSPLRPHLPIGPPPMPIGPQLPNTPLRLQMHPIPIGPQLPPTFIGPQLPSTPIGPQLPPISTSSGSQWNQSLFQLASDYGGGDDQDDRDEEDDDCPNFSVYSAESMQVANQKENDSNNDKEKQDDEISDETEDLVQLGDDDEIPDSIDIDLNTQTNETQKIPESEMYEPDSPTEEVDEPKNDEDMVLESDNENMAIDSDNENTENETIMKNAEIAIIMKNTENELITKDVEIENELPEKADNDNELSEKADTDNELPETTNNVNELREEADNDNELPEKADNDNELESITEGQENESVSNKKNVLELYDDSDWEELNIDKDQVLKKIEKEIQKENNKETDDKEKQTKKPDVNNAEDTEEEGEIDRSYTPCLDEKNEEEIQTLEPHNEVPSTEHAEGNLPPSSLSQNTEKDNNDGRPGIAGMETELISDEEETLNEAAKKKESQNKKLDNKRSRRNDSFKKLKNQRDRNYRNEPPSKVTKRRNSRSRSRSNNKENRNSGRNRNFRRYSPMGRGRRFRRKEIERYNVRKIINQPRTYKDRYGRDTSRRPLSRTSQSRSRSRSPLRKNGRSRSRSIPSRSKSRSKSPIRIRRSLSITLSPSPPRRRVSPGPAAQRRRRRSTSIRRSPPIRRRSRTPLRARSHSNSPQAGRMNGRRPIIYSPSPAKKQMRRRSMSFTSRSKSPMSRNYTPPRRSPSLTFKRPTKRRRPKDGKKKKRKRNPAITDTIASPPPLNHRVSSPTLPSLAARKKKRPRPQIDHNRWSISPEYDQSRLNENQNDQSWTPPIVSPNHAGLTVMIKNKNSKKKRDKKKKAAEKRKELHNKKDKRKKKDSPMAPSKEVFASGDNILVSVSFNKDGTTGLPQQTTVVTLPPTRQEILSGARRASPGRNKAKGTRQPSLELRQRRRRKNDAKPVVIIDLDRSPFQVIQSPRDIIVLTDSDTEINIRPDPRRQVVSGAGNVDKDRNLGMNGMSSNSEMEMYHRHREDSVGPNLGEHVNAIGLGSGNNAHLTDDSYEMQQQIGGPKTPPEPPVVKFSLSTKAKIRPRNPLHDEQEEQQKQLQNQQQEISEDDNQQEINQQMNQQQIEHEQQQDQQATMNKIGPNTPPDSGPCSPDVYDPFDPTKSPSGSPGSPNLSSSMDHHPLNSSMSEKDITNEDIREEHHVNDKNLNPADLVMSLMNSSNQQQQSQDIPQSQQSLDNENILSKSDEAQSVKASVTVLSNIVINPLKMSHTTIPLISSPPPPSAVTTHSSKSSQNIIGITKLPPNLSSKRIINNNDEINAANTIANLLNDIESPYSPGSDDYDDLFEPPPDLNRPYKSKSKGAQKSTDIFDNLFGTTSPVPGGGGLYARLPSYKPSIVKRRRYNRKSVKVAKVHGKNDEENIKIYDDLPNSAVELLVKDKFLRKLNRQERVVEEVKLVLKPHYNKKHITKEDYKDILRRAVPKICHSKSGEINPKKIQNLIEAYVKKFRQRNKLGVLNTRQVSSDVKCVAYLKKL